MALVAQQVRVALVTGANRGLGHEIARRLAGAGMRVWLGARAEGDGLRAATELTDAGLDVHPLRLDVTDGQGLAAAAAIVEREHGRLDVLVNNAGTITEVWPAQLNGEALRRVLEVNVVGAAATIHAFLPLLARSPAARIVNVTSTTASLTLTSDGTDFGGNAELRIAYSTSKSALNMLTVQYARAFAADPDLCHIKVNAGTPGFVATALNNYAGTRSVDQGARVIVDLATLADDGPTGGFFNDQGPVPW